MKKFLVLILVSFFLMTGNTMAMLFGDDGQNLQNVLDDFTMDGNSTIDATSDMIPDFLDSFWSISSADGSVITQIAQLASFARSHKFGIFDPFDPDNKVEIFAGKIASNFRATLNIDENGKVWLNHADTGIIFTTNLFGCYLDSSYYVDGGFWYSDSLLNSDSMDHMYAYQGKNTDTLKTSGHESGLWIDSEFILAFEDLKESAPSDRDYTDFVIMVESVQPMQIPFMLPTTQEYYHYSPVANPAFNADPPSAKPFAVENTDSGALNFYLALPPFVSPVDIYLGLYAPHLSSEIFSITPDNGLIPISSAIVKWRQNTAGPVYGYLYENVPADSFLPGIYFLYVLVTPADKLDTYYLWETYFEMPYCSSRS
jgi:hypothetical protein